MFVFSRILVRVIALFYATFVLGFILEVWAGSLVARESSHMSVGSHPSNMKILSPISFVAVSSQMTWARLMCGF